MVRRHDGLTPTETDGRNYRGTTSASVDAHTQPQEVEYGWVAYGRMCITMSLHTLTATELEL